MLSYQTVLRPLIHHIFSVMKHLEREKNETSRPKKDRIPLLSRNVGEADYPFPWVASISTKRDPRTIDRRRAFSWRTLARSLWRFLRVTSASFCGLALARVFRGLISLGSTPCFWGTIFASPHSSYPANTRDFNSGDYFIFGIMVFGTWAWIQHLSATASPENRPKIRDFFSDSFYHPFWIRGKFM